MSLIAAGLAMYGLLSVFPALTATVSLWSLFVSPTVLIRQIGSFGGMLPPGVWQLFQSQLRDMASHGQSALTATAAIGAVVGLALIYRFAPAREPAALALDHLGLGHCGHFVAGRRALVLDLRHDTGKLSEDLRAAG